jgi:hypothetical protein
MRRNSCATRRKVKVIEDAEEIYVKSIQHELHDMLDNKLTYSDFAHMSIRNSGNALFEATCMGSDKLLETAHDSVLNWEIGFNDFPKISSIAVIKADVYRRTRCHDYIIKINICYVLKPEIRTPKSIRNLLK